MDANNRLNELVRTHNITDSNSVRILREFLESTEHELDYDPGSNSAPSVRQNELLTEAHNAGDSNLSAAIDEIVGIND